METVEVTERWQLRWSGNFMLCLLKMQWCITSWMQDFVNLFHEFSEFCIWSLITPLMKALLIMLGQEVHATFRIVLAACGKPHQEMLLSRQRSSY